MTQFIERAERVKLLPLRAHAPAIGSLVKPSLMVRLRNGLYHNLLFVILVGLPVLVAALYFGVMASDIYVSETKYVVRTPSDRKGGALGSIVQSSGISKATDDAHAINAFFQSREAMELLRKDVGLDKAYYDSADAFSRFPALFQRRSNEAMFKYFLSMTKVKYDKTTGITTLSVSAFEPDTAQKIARCLMESGEVLANQLTQRMREDLVKGAITEAELARKRAYEAQDRIAQWRNREGQVDPTKFSTAIVEVIAKLSMELAQLRAHLAESQTLSPNSPSMVAAQNRIKSLKDQIDLERLALAGGFASLAPKIVEFEQLQLERQFAESLFSTAVVAQETARVEAQKQQIYVEWIARPPLPDYPERPKRLLAVLIVGAIAFLVFMIANKILTNIARHGAFARYFSRTQM